MHMQIKLTEFSKNINIYRIKLTFFKVFSNSHKFVPVIKLIKLYKSCVTWKIIFSSWNKIKTKIRVMKFIGYLEIKIEWMYCKHACKDN